jgi:glycosyltransferase involved in cell wall biosynthesis
VNVLLFNAYYPPDRSASATMAAAAVDALRARDHHVTVVAGRPSYDTPERTPWRPLTRANDVIRVGSTAGPRAEMRNRLANYATYSALATPTAVAARADVVIGMTDPPFVGALAAAAARARRRPFVYWIQDYHPAFALAAGILRDGDLVRRWAAVQRRTLRAADALIVLGDDMAETVIRAGAHATRVHVIPNGTALVSPPADDGPDIANDVRKDFDFVLVHGGNIGFAGAWNPLLAAAEHLDPHRDGIVFIGDGAQRPELERRAAPLRNVRFIDRLDPAEYASASRAADLQLVTLRRGLEGLLVPTKLYDALAAGRPVLAVADERSDVVKVVRRHQCGLVADPDDPAAIVAAIQHAKAHPDELAAMGTNAAHAAEQFARPQMMDDLVTLIERVVAR